MNKNRNELLLSILILGSLANGLPVLAEGSSPAPVDVVISGPNQVVTTESLLGANSLTVSPGSVAIIDFTGGSKINLAGNITNSGSIYAVSNDPAATSANFAALNIFNNPGSLFTTALPAQGLTGFSQALSNLSLSLTAVNSIVNQGVISSAGSLSMTAASVTNTGSVTATANINALIGTGGLINSGIISSAGANINIATLAAHDLLINNTRGTIEALLGNIAMSTAASDSLQKLNLSVIGGDLLSKVTDLTSPSGTVYMNVGRVDGRLDISACEAHVLVSSPGLTLGKMNLTGDPLFWNSNGWIVLNLSQMTFPGANVSVISNSDILNDSNTGYPIDVSSTTGDAGSILLIAGANFTTAPPPGNGTPLPQGGPDSSSVVTINGASSTGGKIDLSGLTYLSTAATGTGVNAGNGGSITLVAYTGSNTDSGSIFMNQIAPVTGKNLTITTGTADTSGTKVNGNVMIIGGTNASPASCGGCSIQTGIINTTGGTLNPLLANNGNITIASATPAFWGNPGGGATAVTLQSSALAGVSQITVTDSSNISGQIYLNALGGNSELVTVQQVNGNQVTLQGPLAYAHQSNETVYSQASSLTIDPTNPAGLPSSGAGLSGTDFGGIVLPGTLGGGTISLNHMAAGGNINLTGSGAQVIANNGTNLALVAGGSIFVSGSNMQLNLSANSANANSLLMIAGAAFTTPPLTAGANAFTVSGASATGGMINLAGLSSLTTANTGSGNGAGGSITMAAFYGTGPTPPSISGTISAPGSLTITTGSADQTVSDNPYNGNVFIIAGAPTGNAINIGNITANGTPVNPQTANNGNVIIASATPAFLGNPGNSATAVTTVGGGSFTDMQLTVTDTSNLSTSQTIFVNTLGGNAETLTISQINSPSLVFTTPLQFNHTNGDSIYVSASTLTVDPNNITGAPTSGLAMTDFGGIVVPGKQQSGNIAVGTINANYTIAITTNPVASANNGQIQLNGSMSLSECPQPAFSAALGYNVIQQYQVFPTITVTGSAVTVAVGSTINSQITSSSNPVANAPNTINIVTQSLTNNGTIQGGNPTDSPFSNAYINVTSPTGSNLSLSGTGSFSVPGYSVIEIAAADNATLTLGGAALPTFSTGTGSVVIFNAQGANGTISLPANQTVTVNGGPIILLNTPTLQLGSAAALTATGQSMIAVSNGYTQNDLNVQLLGANPATMSTSAGGTINFRPRDGQNLKFTTNVGGMLQFSGATAQLATSGSGTTTGTSNLTGAGTPVVNPAGGILGVEFQPYVGPYFTNYTANNGKPPQFINFAGYPFQVVVALLAPLAAQQQVQVLSTYTQQYSCSYVIGAAKQVGLNVSAGVFVDIDPNTGNNTAPSRTAFDSYWALSQAAKYGNVVDIVVGNEDIVAPTGNPDPSSSVSTLRQAIQNVQAMRSNYTNPVTGQPFSAVTLPVTTRQEIGVLTGNVTKYSSTRQLLNTVDSYIYGNVYPFFYFNTYGGLTPGMSQLDFTKKVEQNMSNQYGLAQQAFITAKQAAIDPVPTPPDIRVGETGWATELLAPSSNLYDGYGYAGSGLTIQSTQFAQWYYPAMQTWSATYQNAITNKQGVVISAYFGSYNEPWKGIDGGIPGGISGQATTVNNTPSVGPSAGPITINTSGANTFPTLTPASILVNPNKSTQEVQNITTIVGPNVTVGQLLNQHNNGEGIDAGHPEEPYFGLLTSSGTFPLNTNGGAVQSDPGNGYVFTLTGTTMKFPQPVYQPGALPPAPAPQLSSLDLTDPLTVSFVRGLQSAGSLGGTLAVNLGNTILGGSLFIRPQDIQLGLTSINIPANVSVVFQNFQAAQPINVTITGASSSNQVMINGVANFTGIGTTPVINIASNQNPTVLNIGTTGQLLSQGGLTIQGNGNMTINSPIIAGGSIALTSTAGAGAGDISVNRLMLVAGSGGIAISSAGNVTTGSLFGGAGAGNNIVVQAAGSYVLQPFSVIQTPNAISVNTTGAQTYTNSYLLSFGTGNITLNSVGGAITAGALQAANGNVSLTSQAADVNINGFQLVSTVNGNLSLNAPAGNINMNGLLSTATGNIAFQAAQNININGLTLIGGTGDVMANSTAGSVTQGQFQLILAANGGVTLTGNQNLTLNGSLIARNAVNLTATNGSLTTGQFQLIQSTAGNISLMSNGNMNLGSLIFATGGTVDLTTSGNLTINQSVLAGGNVTINASGLLQSGIGGTVSSLNGSIAMTGNVVDLSGGVYSYRGGNVSVTANGGGATTSSVFALGGSLTITANTGGALRIRPFSTIFAAGPTANVLLRHNGNVAGDNIVLDQFALIQAISSTAGNGNVTLSANGGANPPQLNGNQPANVTRVTLNGGKVFFGDPVFNPGITAGGFTSLALAKGANITFYISLVHGSGNQAIVLSSGNVIIADPPTESLPVVSPPPPIPQVSVVVSPANPVSTDFSRLVPVLFAPNTSTASPVDTIPGAKSEDHFTPVFTDNEASQSEDLPSNFKPIAYAPSITAGFNMQNSCISNNRSNRASAIHRFDLPTAHIRHLGSTAIKYQREDCLRLHSGDVLVNAVQKSVVGAGACMVLIEPGAIVLVSREGQVTKVRNLHDRRTSEVQVVANGHTVKVPAGQEVLIADDGDDAGIRRSVVKDRTGRRRSESLSPGILSSEVSIVNLMQTSDVLSGLYRSQDPSDKAIVSKVLKMAAAIQQVTASRGAYTASEPKR